MASWPQATADASGGDVQPGAGAPSSPRHTVLPPPPASPLAPEQTVPLPETGLLDVVLCDHRQAFTLFNHLTLAAAQGRTHAMELLAGAVAMELRLHSQAVLDVLCPLLERRYGAEGAQMAARLRSQLQAVERDELELLTFRRERDWPALVHRADLMHKDFAAHVHEVEVRVLPRLAADMNQEELVSAGLLFQQQKQTASLAPQTGSEAFTAAARLGPDAASVLGGPLLAGEYQTHTHSHAVTGVHSSGAAFQAGGGQQQQQQQPQPQQQVAASQGKAGWGAALPVATPDKVVTPSQQGLMGEEL